MTGPLTVILPVLLPFNVDNAEMIERLWSDFEHRDVRLSRSNCDFPFGCFRLLYRQQKVEKWARQMSRLLRIMALLVLAGCGGGSSTAPRNLDDACSIASQRPNYIRAMERTQRRWGVPVHVQMATIYQESKFDGDARTPLRYALGVIPMGRQSSAYGYAQALDATWDEYRRETGNRGAKRDDIRDATDFMGWYMNISRDRNGIPLNDARNQYLAYHEGHTGYARGSYNSKSWLLRVSGEVASRSNRYRSQLASCRR